METRHKYFPESARRTIVRDESGTADVEVPIGARSSRSNSKRLRNLRNIELLTNERGQFLVFKTNSGESFSINLDCQEEYGFEAKEVLCRWADEQPG